MDFRLIFSWQHDGMGNNSILLKIVFYVTPPRIRVMHGQTMPWYIILCICYVYIYYVYVMHGISYYVYIYIYIMCMLWMVCIHICYVYMVYIMYMLCIKIVAMAWLSLPNLDIPVISINQLDDNNSNPTFWLPALLIGDWPLAAKEIDFQIQNNSTIISLLEKICFKLKVADSMTSRTPPHPHTPFSDVPGLFNRKNDVDSCRSLKSGRAFEKQGESSRSWTQLGILCRMWLESTW